MVNTDGTTRLQTSESRFDVLGSNIIGHVMFHHFFSQKLYDSLILATVQIIKTAGKCS